ncbi:hypothetical protein [Micromonospora sp. NBC_01813]|uniref:hypothetical protein n=1 Tax=Micromonospora sp. NBC_01813 TaxID=2975988 RepID=UPI002DD7D78B|nr:hypothetical protein [Micromonospora sp. NBC_01813]WSA09787.1 hypothetical protein OG958_02930 [Micromonospora sp. NBC_01813]
MDEWLDVTLDVDDDALSERGPLPGERGLLPDDPAGGPVSPGAGPPWIDQELPPRGQVVLDEALRALLRENRLALWRGEPIVATDTDGRTALDLTMRVVAHAHPDCRFRWVRFRADFAGTAGATVRDLSPREEIATAPVKLKTTRTIGLTFEIAAVPLGPEAALSRVAEQDVFLPKVTTSGARFRHAHWDFTAVGEQPLHVDRDLRALVEVPARTPVTRVSFTLRASVAVTGLAGLVPLLGRRTVEFQVHQHLR